MQKVWNSIQIVIIRFKEIDIIRTSRNDDYEGEIDWG